MSQPSEGMWKYDEDAGEIVDSHDRLIADLDDSDVSLEEDNANGRLMAASKELLAACIKAMWVYQLLLPGENEEPIDGQEVIAADYAELKALVLKAKGGTS